MKTALDPEIASVLEIVIDGLTSEAVANAMRAGLRAIVELGATAGAARVSAGNYGGKLGPHHYHLRTCRPTTATSAPWGRRNMKPLVLRLRAAPEQRLDLSPLTPQRLAGRSRARDRRHRTANNAGGRFASAICSTSRRKRRAHRCRGRIGEVRPRRRGHERGIDHG